MLRGQGSGDLQSSAVLGGIVDMSIHETGAYTHCGYPQTNDLTTSRTLNTLTSVSTNKLRFQSGFSFLFL